MTARRRLTVTIESWPLAKPFTIARGTSRTTEVVLVQLDEAGASGRGESTPRARYGETPEGVVARIEAMRDRLEAPETPLIGALGLRGAAANAVDCALIDLAARRTGQPAWAMLGLARPRALATTVTVSLNDPAEMADDARAAAAGGLIKVKLGGSDDLDMARIEAVRAAAPDARLFCDANEGWTRDRLVDYAPDLHRLGVEMIEQPVPAADDECLRSLDLPMRLCADESYHLAADAPGLVGKYDMVNVKLDKTGGLTGGLEAVRAARALGLDMMVGCMLGTSLAMAPAILAGQGAAFVDLDAPLLLARDRAFPVRYEGGRLFPADQRLWG